MGSPKTPDAPKADYKGDIKSFVKGLKGSFPDVLGLEGKYRDDFGGLNLGDAGGFLKGQKGEKGIVQLGNFLTKQAGNQIERERRGELKGMRDQTGLTRKFLRDLSPQSARSVKFANQQSIAAQKAAQGLTGQEERSAQQFAREGAADRGRLFDNSAIASEVLNRDNILTQKRAEASAATQNAYNLANSFYSAPGLQLASRTPAGYGAGQSYLEMGLGAIGANKPQLVDIGAGLNLGAAGRQNQFAASQAGAQADNAQRAQMISAGAGVASGAAMGAMYGSVVPGIGTAFGAVAGGLAGGASGYAASDKRLKKDIKKVGKTDEGLPIYTYKYKGQDTTQMGVMAQDVKKKKPKAVAGIGGGFLGVDYSQIK